MRKIDNIQEVHKILLDIAKEFHRICEKENIPYYMIGGTMLGAIRHKGFIPWDDDMDFGIPRQYYQKAIEVLQKELPSPYRCNTYLNNPAVRFCFFKIDDYSTIIHDLRLPLPAEQHLGINIDVFPLDCVDSDSSSVRKIMALRTVNRMLYIDNPQSKIKQLLKRLLRYLLPIPRISLLRKEEQILEHCHSSKTLANVFGRWKEREFIPIEWYGKDEYFQFENQSFRGLKEYDLYLSRLYGEYMKLPPEEDRVAHVNDFYYR